MNVFKQSIIILMIVACCLGMVGCTQTQVNEHAVPDSEVLNEDITSDEIKLPSDPGEAEQMVEKPKQPTEKEESTDKEHDDPEQTVEEPKQPAEETKQPADEPATAGKAYIAVESSKASFNKEQLLKKGDLVLKVRLVSKAAEEMVNPDGKAKDAGGNLINNRLVTSYNAEVLEVYKGDYSEKTIVVKISEGYGLSQDLILHGEDEKFILASPLIRFTPETEKEYLLVLVSVNGENKVASGYFIFGPEIGCFSLNDNDEWVNTRVTTEVSFNDKTVKSEIDSLMSEE